MPMRDPVSGNGVEVVPQFDEATERHRLSVQRMHHGNVRVSIIDADFVNGSDYAILSKAAKSFLGKVSSRSLAARGEGDKRKEQTVSDFREAIAMACAAKPTAASRSSATRVWAK